MKEKKLSPQAAETERNNSGFSKAASVIDSEFMRNEVSGFSCASKEYFLGDSERKTFPKAMMLNFDLMALQRKTKEDEASEGSMISKVVG